MKKLPGWYRLMLEKRIKKLFFALTCLKTSENFLAEGNISMSKLYLAKAKRIAK